MWENRKYRSHVYCLYEEKKTLSELETESWNINSDTVEYQRPDLCKITVNMLWLFKCPGAERMHSRTHLEFVVMTGFKAKHQDVTKLAEHVCDWIWMFSTLKSILFQYDLHFSEFLWTKLLLKLIIFIISRGADKLYNHLVIEMSESKNEKCSITFPRTSIYHLFSSFVKLQKPHFFLFLHCNLSLLLPFCAELFNRCMCNITLWLFIAVLLCAHVLLSFASLVLACHCDGSCVCSKFSRGEKKVHRITLNRIVWLIYCLKSQILSTIFALKGCNQTTVTLISF